ncbi:ADP-ribosylation factor GTPase-activating protein AGD4 [Raphanus sativus]|nr:ADP-ribosylation factor GTPase-activating protein AGD4 [Raphanus sativus]
MTQLRVRGSKTPTNQETVFKAVHCSMWLVTSFGADPNMRDYHGRTPLHHCISSGNHKFAKILLRRGARPSIEDDGGLSVLERAMEMGAITDEELFLLLAECA